LDTVATGQLTIPRSALTVLRQPPGWILLRGDDLRKPSPGWKVDGKPTFTESGVSLDAQGQSLTLDLREGCKAGRAALTFHVAERISGAAWVVEAEFLAQKQPCRLTIHLAGQDLPRVLVEGLEGETSAVPSLANGRLVVQFSASSLRVQIDDRVLWHSLKQGPRGPLIRWRFACLPKPGQAVKG